MHVTKDKLRAYEGRYVRIESVKDPNGTMPAFVQGGRVYTQGGITTLIYDHPTLTVSVCPLNQIKNIQRESRYSAPHELVLARSLIRSGKKEITLDFEILHSI